VRYRNVPGAQGALEKGGRGKKVREGKLPNAVHGGRQQNLFGASVARGGEKKEKPSHRELPCSERRFSLRPERTLQRTRRKNKMAGKK